MLAHDPIAERGQRPRPAPVLEIGLQTATVVFAMVSLLYLSYVPDDLRLRPLIILGLPALLVVASVVTGWSHLVFATSSYSLLVGLLTLFSVGMPMLAMGVCLLAWYVVRTFRLYPHRDRWGGVLLFNMWFLAMLFPFFALLLIHF